MAEVRNSITQAIGDGRYIQLDGSNTATKFNTPYANTIHVAQSGGDHTTIQAAVTAASAGDVIVVHPGTYTESITVAVNNLTIWGLDKERCILTNSDADVLDWGTTTGGEIHGMTVTLTVTGTTPYYAIRNTAGGDMFVDVSILNLTSNGNITGEQPHCVSPQGDAIVQDCTVVYTNTGNATAGTDKKAPFDIRGAGSIVLRNNRVTINGSGTSRGSTLVYDHGGGTGMTVERNVVTITDTTRSAFGAIETNGTISNIIYNKFTITANTAGQEAVGIVVENAVSIRSSFNQYTCISSSGSAYSFDIGGSATLISHFDDIDADDGQTGAGTYRFVNSPINGELWGDTVFCNTIYGGTGAADTIDMYGSTHALLGSMRVFSPFDIKMGSIVPALVNPAYGIRNSDTFTTPTGAVVMGMINSSGSTTVNTGIWFCSQISDNSTYILTLAPAFSAFTLFNAFPIITNQGYSGVTTHTGSIGMQIAVEHHNEYATASVCSLDRSMQHRPRPAQNLAGGSMTLTLAEGWAFLPELESVVGSSCGFTDLSGFRCANPRVTNHLGTTIMGTYTGYQMDDITNKLSSTVVTTLLSALAAGTNNYFLRNTGGAKSDLGAGDVYWSASGGGLPFGEIYVKNNATTMSVSSAGFTQVTVFDTNGQSNLTTPAHGTDDITIDQAGKYLVTVSMTVENNAGAGHVIDVEVAKNNQGTSFANLHAHRTLASGTDIGSISLSGIIDLSAADTVEVWISSDSAAAKNITVEDITLSVTHIGG